MSCPYPTITVEEHWLSQHVRDFYVSQNEPDPNDESGLLGRYTPPLMDFGAQRLKEMDEANVGIQVVSHVNNTITLDVATCIKVNDELAERIKQHPGRFAGFATLPMIDPPAAAAELHRCIITLNFVGAMIDSNCSGRFYDDASFRPVFETAQSLDVPIYIHPSPNPATKPLLYDGNYHPAIADVLSTHGWGWHNETAIHFLRLYASGLFDALPRLKLMLGHLGEMLPFQLDRVEGIFSHAGPAIGVHFARSLRQVWDENVWITVAGVFYLAPMAAVLRQCKLDRIIFSVDYPFGNNGAGRRFLHSLKDEGLVVDDDVLRGIAYGNAEKLLKIKMVKE